MVNISRRTFLAASAAGAGALAFGPTATADTKRTVPHGRPIRVGVIGLGEQGSLHWGIGQHFHLHGYDVEYVAVADPWKARREHAKKSREAPVDAYSNGTKLIERDDIDAVIIATPDHSHATLANAALESGKHVLCSPPMALSLDDAARVRETAKRSGCVYQTVPLDVRQDFCRAISDAIGNVQYVQATVPNVRMEQWFPDECLHLIGDPTEHDVEWDAFALGEQVPFSASRFRHWRRYRSFSGGVAFSEFGMNLADLIAKLQPGELKSASAAGGCSTDKVETPDSLVANFEFESGIRIVMRSTFDPDKGGTTYRGERGRIVNATCYPDKGEPYSLTPPSPKVTDDDEVPLTNVVYDETRWFDAIRGDAPCVFNEDVAYEATVPIALAMQAYEQRRTIYV